MRQAERIYGEVRERIGDSTGNKPTGALGEAIAVRVYGAERLEPQSNKAYDLVAADGRKIQVKTRVLENRVTMFGRQYHENYDSVFLLALTGDYEVAWAVELTKEQVRQCSGAKRPEGRSGAGSTNIRFHKVQQLRRNGEVKDLTAAATEALSAL
jgi:uncharacterized protein YjbJ (UPF0337 family)